jgi:hypothetical protein
MDCPSKGETKDLQIEILEEKQARSQVVFLCDTPAKPARVVRKAA